MKTLKTLTVFFMVLTLVVLTFGQPCPAGEIIQIKDMTGRQVSVPKDPARIIGLGPGTLRLILYLESKNKVVGVEDIEKQFPTTRPYWIANSELGRLPSVGPGGPSTINSDPDLEKVLALKPDVIFITYLDREKSEALQKKIGIPIVVLTYGPFGTFNEKLYDSLRRMGQILVKQDRAEAVVRFIENSRRDLLKRVEGYPENRKPLVYIGGIGFRGTHGLESTETDYAPFEWVKVNPAVKQESQQGHLFADKEKLLTWNPDIIFIDSGGSDLIRQDYEKKPAFYQGLKAFRNKKVYILHAFNWYMTNIGTVLSDAYAVGGILYPKEFKDVQLEKKSDEIYSFLLGRPIFKEMEKHHGRLGGIPSYLK
jgi:iron complex transport system substrate-binding protein